MSWQSKVLGLCKKYGAAAKFAATTILGTVLPGSPAIVALVGQAFDAAQKTAQDDWEINLSKAVQTTAENQARLEQMVDILGGQLQHLFAQVACLEQMPDLARQMVRVAEANDQRFHEAVVKLDGIAQRFDRLEQQNNQILAGQKHANGMIEEMLPLVRGIAGSSNASAILGHSVSCVKQSTLEGTSWIVTRSGNSSTWHFHRYGIVEFAHIQGKAGKWSIDGHTLQVDFTNESGVFTWKAEINGSLDALELIEFNRGVFNGKLVMTRCENAHLVPKLGPYSPCSLRTDNGVVQVPGRKLFCPHCEKELIVPREWGGRSTTCAICTGSIVLPKNLG